MRTKLWSQSLKERDHSEDLRWADNIRGEKGWEGVNWIHLAQDRDQWRTVMNMLMNLRFQKNGGEFIDYVSDR
jgi:hypothetical protein